MTPAPLRSSELSTHRRRLSPGHDITNGAVANFR